MWKNVQEHFEVYFVSEEALTPLNIALPKRKFMGREFEFNLAAYQSGGKSLFFHPGDPARLDCSALFRHRSPLSHSTAGLPDFQTKNPNLGKFWRILQWKMLVYFMYGHMVFLRSSGISCGHLV
jgi:hypothetical protein